MGRIAFGFILGAIATSIGFVTFYRVPSGVETSQSARSVSAVALPDPATMSSPRAPDSVQSGAEEPAISSASSNETEEARLIRLIGESRQIVTELSADLESLQIARRLAEEPVVYPLSLSSDFDWVLNEPIGKLLHGLIQREDRDEAWAPQMEAELQEFIYNQTDVISGFGAPTISCRSTRCEVTLINNVADEELEAVAQRLRGDFHQHDVYERFAFSPNSFWVGEHYEDGVATIFWSLPRRPE